MTIPPPVPPAPIDSLAWLSCDLCHAVGGIPDVPALELARGIFWVGGWRWGPAMKPAICPTCVAVGMARLRRGYGPMAGQPTWGVQ